MIDRHCGKETDMSEFKNKQAEQNSGFQIADLSEFMDGEMAGETSVFLLRRINNDTNLSQKWQRYHLIRDVICDQKLHVSNPEFCAYISKRCAEMDTEAIAISEQTNAEDRNRWFKPALGLAMTAAVAFIAVTSVVQQPLNKQGIPNPGVSPLSIVADISAHPDFVTPENPLITPASSMVIPASSVSSGGANSTYPMIPGSSDLITTEYLFRHSQLEGDVGRPIFIHSNPHKFNGFIVTIPNPRKVSVKDVTEVTTP